MVCFFVFVQAISAMQYHITENHYCLCFHSQLIYILPCMLFAKTKEEDMNDCWILYITSGWKFFATYYGDAQAIFQRLPKIRLPIRTILLPSSMAMA